MAAGAGFLFDPTSYAPPRNTASAAAASSSSATPIEPRRLTASQLTRLRSHLDDALLSIQRRFARRFHDAGSSSSSSSSASPPPLGTLTAYTSSWTHSILPLVSRIDPYGSAQTATLTAYAMTIADAAPNGMTGYDLPQEGRGEALLGALELLGLIDALWAALLVGRSLSLSLATRRVRARLGVTDQPEGEDEEAARERTKADRVLRDSFPVSGSLGARTTSATDRVRLRNLLMDRKEAIRAWVGEQVGVRLEDEMDEEEEEEMRLSGRRRSRRREEGGARRREREGEGEGEGELDGIREVGDEVEEQPGANDDDEEGELEEVEVPAPYANGADGDDNDDGEGGGTAEERGHYRDLFARKLNPDEDDDSDSQEEEEEEEEEEQLPHREEEDATGSRKRRRVDFDEDEGEAGSHTETEPIAPAQAPLPPADAAQDGHSSSFNLPTDALAIERLTSQVFSRSLAALERLDAAAMATTI